MSAAADLTRTALWRDALETPETIAATLDAADGHGELADLVASRATRRIVATGNGASWYVALALWLASLSAGAHAPVVTVPAGLLAAGGLAWRDGDVLLAFSSSGELRDLVQVVRDPACPRPVALVTADTASSLGLLADVCAVVRVAHQRATTHTQAYLGAAAVAFDVLGRAVGDPSLRDVARRAPALLERQLREAPAWAAGAALPVTLRTGVVFGTRLAWVAALEGALLFKEVSGLAAEGMEVREGATTGMYALTPRDVAVSLPLAHDPLAAEAAAICAGTGAILREAPWVAGADPRAAVFAHFAHPLALAIGLALDRRRDPDNPGWMASYEATARGLPDRGRE